MVNMFMFFFVMFSFSHVGRKKKAQSVVSLSMSDGPIHLFLYIGASFDNLKTNWKVHCEVANAPPEGDKGHIVSDAKDFRSLLFLFHHSPRRTVYFTILPQLKNAHVDFLRFAYSIDFRDLTAVFMMLLFLHLFLFFPQTCSPSAFRRGEPAGRFIVSGAGAVRRVEFVVPLFQTPCERRCPGSSPPSAGLLVSVCWGSDPSCGRRG